ncbi:YcnI family copper-binding membrane protein [Sphaerisporangium fuscum]|uniref:YcnI family copper-binding membrane protein n=1 Tax=Sphaerisporangium fuscum TaxID=2835868 RepID=UPI001BDCA959|nr:YcnI family protein [Sphaerisporangium fuscum]
MAFAAICRRATAVTAGALAITVGLALPALAHVTIDPGTAEQGGWTKLAFRVPNERDDASTTKLEVTFPTDHPLPFVSVKPVPGWNATLTRGKLPQPIVSDDGDKVTESVLKITWAGGKIQPGQFQEFEVSVGPLPKNVDSLTFPAVQTYSGGETVNWTDAPKSDGSEAEHPAPVLKLVPASAEGEGHSDMGGAKPSAAPSVAAMKQATPSASGGSDGTARTLGIAGIVVGLLGAGVGVAGLRRSRS